MTLKENNDSSCLAPDIQLLLPDYFSGHLADSDRAQVDAHLRDCDECRQALGTLWSLQAVDSRAGIESSDHPSRQQIASYYLRDTQMGSAASKSVRLHLESCDICKHEFELLTSLERSINSVSMRADEESTGWLTGFLALFRSPVLGYALFLLALYPAWRWMTRTEGPRPAIVKNILPTESFTLREAVRGADSMVVVERTEGQQLVLLHIPLYTIPNERQYSFDIVDNAEKRHPLKSFADFAVAGDIALIADFSAISDGRCILHVSEAALTPSGDTSITSFVFDLRTK